MASGSGAVALSSSDIKLSGVPGAQKEEDFSLFVPRELSKQFY